MTILREDDKAPVWLSADGTRALHDLTLAHAVSLERNGIDSTFYRYLADGLDSAYRDHLDIGARAVHRAFADVLYACERRHKVVETANLMLSGSAIARAAGVSKATISRMLTGGRTNVRP